MVDTQTHAYTMHARTPHVCVSKHMPRISGGREHIRYPMKFPLKHIHIRVSKNAGARI